MPLTRAVPNQNLLGSAQVVSLVEQFEQCRAAELRSDIENKASQRVELVLLKRNLNIEVELYPPLRSCLHGKFFPPVWA